MIDTTTSELLSLLHRGGRWAYWWEFPSKRSYWWPIGKPPLPLPNQKYDTYFPVNPCNACKKPTERGTIKDVVAVNCLFADIDAKQYADSKDAALAHIRSLPIAPTVIVDSGGGFHCYWILSEPFVFSSDVDRQRARVLQARWVEFVGGDTGAKDIAHLLRVPGTYNHKAQPSRSVSFVAADFGKVHSLEQLDDLLALSTAHPSAVRQPPADGNRTNPGHEQAYARAEADLSRLAPWRCDEYPAWIEVGMSLSELGTKGLDLWQEWSRTSSKYEPGACERKWFTFSPNAGLTLRSLSYWAEHDDPAPATQQPLGKVTVPTDDELASRWLNQYPLTAWGSGTYRRYCDGVWLPTGDDQVKCEFLAVLEGSKREGVRPSSRLLSSVNELARVKISVPPEKWDANPDFLVCANGSLHIPTRTLGPHDPKLYATSGVPYDYNSKAPAPTWATVLATSCPDSQWFLQEFAGYCLTTDTKYELAVWLAGQPGGGKSTFLAGLQAMLGPRVGLLGLADLEKSRFALTSLPGKTLMVSSEQPGTYLTATHVLNALISGEPITVDMKFRDPVTVVPRAKLMWAMNELPRVCSGGSGLFRRVKVVPFPPIPESLRDPAVKERVTHEGAGILNWALDGLQRLRERGQFAFPNSVSEASKQFQQSNDVPALFVAETCLTGSDYKIGAGALYAAYAGWCRDNGHKPASSTALAEDWRRLGFERRRCDGRSWWYGVSLMTN